MRNGGNTGPRRPRAKAINSENTRMTTSAIRKILMLRTKALMTSGHAATAASQLKNDSWTAGPQGRR